MDPTVELAVDGFPLDPADHDIRFHRELSTWLELEKSNRVPVALQFDPPSERPRWLRPAVRRFAWVRAHSELIAGDRKLDARIAHLISHLVNRIYKPESGVIEEATFAELALQASAIEESGAGSMFRADTADCCWISLKPALVRQRAGIYTRCCARCPRKIASAACTSWRGTCSWRLKTPRTASHRGARNYAMICGN
jgi:hypothetical protein